MVCPVWWRVQAKDDLSPPDSVVGALRFAGGACGSVSITLASHTVRALGALGGGL